MTPLQRRLTRQLASKGIKDAKQMAVALLEKQGSMKNGKLTSHGKQRQELGAAGRAKDRAAKYAGKDPKDYNYNSKTNIATVKKTKK